MILELPKKIALIGGTGFIGSHIVADLAPRTDFVVLGRENRLGLDNVYFRKIQNGVNGFLNLLRDVDAVVHLAAVRPISSGEAPVFERYLPNIQLSAAVFEACRQLNITNVVNISSISVYSSVNRLPFEESQEAVPKDLYGVAKKNVEDLANFYNQFYKLSIKSLRLAQVFGAGEKEGYMFTKFIRQAAARETLEIWGKGEGKREYLYVKDVVNAVYSSLMHSETKGVFNIGTGAETSHQELARVINHVFKNEDNIIFLPGKYEDRSTSVMTSKKAARILGWQSQWDLETALEDMKNEIGSKQE